MSRKGKRACEGSKMTLADPRNPRNGTARAWQRLAAEAYRDAASLCEGRIPSLLTRLPGRPRVGPCSPTETQLSAAQLLAQASALLGAMDAYIVRLVAVAGFSIKECTAHLFGADQTGRPRRSDAEHVGRRLRLALEALAAAWWPEHGPRPCWLPPAVDNPRGCGY